jgi:hypothetical protein
MKNTMLIFILALACFETYSQTSGLENEPYPTTSSKPFPSGKDVFGAFEGRCACQELATLLKREVSSECFKTKLRLQLFQNPETKAPTTYNLVGSFFPYGSREGGKWSLSKGSKTDPDDIIIALEAENQQTIYLQKGDDNVLFFLDNDKNIMTGNELFNYTLNRVHKKPVE